VTSFDVSIDSGAPSVDLPTGVLFWRVISPGAVSSRAATSATWQFTVGASSATQLDSSRGTLFDPNGDGHADAIVGGSGVLNSTGRAYVYYGGPAGLETSSATSLTGPDGQGGGFAGAIASAGDVNGDGYGDTVVGADIEDGEVGRIYVYLGSGSGLSTVPQPIRGLDKFTQFGMAVASAGDVNGDGYADVVVGAPETSSGQGQAYLFLGTPNGLSPSPSQTLVAPETTATNLGFGSALAGAGDVDGDGYADVVIGAPHADLSTGRVYLYRGGPDGLAATPTKTLVGPDGQMGVFGQTLAAGLDVNGDGYADVVVGAPGGGSAPGRVHVFLGGPGGLVPAPAVPALTGPDGASGQFGSALAPANDVNGDGYDDVLVGAQFAATTGRAYLYFGAASGLASSPAATFMPPASASDGHFGSTVAGLGDIDGDHAAELMIGAQFAASGVGAAFLYVGSVSRPPATTPAATLNGPDGAGGDFGAAIASLRPLYLPVIFKTDPAEVPVPSQ
jgi:hypothetical protein